MKLIFAGTPAVAVPALARLVASQHTVLGVITREDASLGRKRVLTPSPVAEAAAASDIPVIKTNALNASLDDHALLTQADLGVIVAYGGFVREPVLSAPRLGWINLHFSLLPAWRGAAPVQHSLINGDSVTGVSVFQLVNELDAGDLLASRSYNVPPDATAGEVLATLADHGAGVLLETISRLADGRAPSHPQIGDPTFAPKLSIGDAELDLTLDAQTIYNRFRGVTPEPGAFINTPAGRLKVHSARPSPSNVLAPGICSLVDGRLLIGTSTTTLELVTVQPAGKRAMPGADWWRGRPSSESPSLLTSTTTQGPTQ